MILQATAVEVPRSRGPDSTAMEGGVSRGRNGASGEDSPFAALLAEAAAGKDDAGSSERAGEKSQYEKNSGKRGSAGPEDAAGTADDSRAAEAHPETETPHEPAPGEIERFLADLKVNAKDGEAARDGKEGRSDEEPDGESAAGLHAAAVPAGGKAAGTGRAKTGKNTDGAAVGKAGEAASAGKTERGVSAGGAGDPTGGLQSRTEGAQKDASAGTGAASGPKTERLRAGEAARDAAAAAKGEAGGAAETEKMIRAAAEKTLRKAAGGESGEKPGAKGERVPRGERATEAGDGESRAVKLEVLDARAIRAAGGTDGGNSAGRQDGSGSDGFTGTHDGLGGSDAVFGARHGSAMQHVSVETSSGLQQDVRTALLRSLQEDANAQIVKNARIMLRDSDRGEISLRLKPEHLGTVRISLFLEDNHIAGRIIVENNTVREAFEQNLQSLQQAFADQGFETGNLDVLVGDGGRENGGRQQEHEGTRAVKIRELEKHTASAAYEYDGYLNLVV